MARDGLLSYGAHAIDDDDVAAVIAVLKGQPLTCGPMVSAFENAFAAKVGAGHAVVCANGTAGLHLAALALDLGPGDCVVVPTLTFLATANAARFVGAEVVFADVDSETGLMGAAQFRDALARAPGPVKAVFPVHLNGQAAPMADIRAEADRHGIKVVEDACHALGTRIGLDSWVGDCRHSHMTVFSFHPVKTIAMGEGGMVTTNDPALAARLASLRSHGMTRDPARFQCADQAFDADGQANPWYYEMAAPGFNYRASDINCALGLSQLAKLDGFVARRARLVAAYDDLLQPLAPLVRPLGRVAGQSPGWHLYVARVDFQAAGRSRAQVMRALSAQGIGTQVHYLPVHRQPYYAQHYGMLRLDGADAYYAQALTLPLFPAMQDGDVARVVAALAQVLGLSQQPPLAALQGAAGL